MNVQTNQTLSSLDTPFLPQFFQLNQNREGIVGRGRVECPQAVARVSAGLRVLDRRCAED